MPGSDGTVYLGIDPGLGTTGYGVLRFNGGSATLLDAGVVRSSTDHELSARLLELYNGVLEVIDRFDPSAMGMEELYAHYRHPTTAIKMGHARGVLCLAAVQRQLRLISIPATRVKKLVTGNGRASKEQVSGMVRHMLGINGEIKPDDVTDALAIAIAAYESDRNDRKSERIRRRHS